jgi:hypothetical protein
MAINFESTAAADIGHALGTGLSQPIHQHLDLLAKKKMIELNRQFERKNNIEKSQGLQALFPQFNQQQLEGLARLDPKSLSKLIETSRAEKEERPLSAVEDLIRSGTAGSQLNPQQQPEQQNAIQQLLNQQSPNQSNQNEPSENDSINNIDPNKLAQMTQQQSTKVTEENKNKNLINTLGAKADSEEAALEKILSQRKDLSPSQRKELRDRTEKRVEKLRTQQEKVNDKFKPFIESAKKKGEGGEFTLEKLGLIEDLVKKGNLAGPLVSTALETLSKGIFGIGVDLFGLTSPDTQLFRKTAKEFIKKAKDLFGSKVTEGEIKLLLETFPSLLQSDEGKLEVVDALKPFAYGEKAMSDSVDEITKEYNGHLPPNFETLVKERAQSKKDEYANQLKSYIKGRKKSEKEKRMAQEVLEPHKAFVRKNFPLPIFPEYYSK